MPQYREYQNPRAVMLSTMLVVVFILGLGYVAFGDFENGNCVMNNDCVLYKPSCDYCNGGHAVNRWMKPFLAMQEEAWCTESAKKECPEDVIDEAYCSPDGVCALRPDCEVVCSIYKQYRSGDAHNIAICGCHAKE